MKKKNKIPPTKPETKRYRQKKAFQEVCKEMEGWRNSLRVL